MTKKTISITATLQAHPNKIEELKSSLHSLTPPTEEEGCLYRTSHQSLEKPTEFLFYEI